MAFRLPPRVARQRVGQRLALDQFERSPEVRDRNEGITVQLSFRSQRPWRAERRPSPRTTPGRGRCVCAAGKKRRAIGVEPHGPASGIRRVEQSLGGGIGVGRSEHPRAEPVARDDVGLVQGQIRHELHGAARPVGRQRLAQTVESGCHGQQADVDLAGTTAAVPVGGSAVDGSHGLAYAARGLSGGRCRRRCRRALAMLRAASSDWRCGRTTRPRGWIVAPWRSTRMVRSLAPTTGGGHDRRALRRRALAALRGLRRTAGVARAVGRRPPRTAIPGSAASSVSTTVSAQAHAPAAVRTERSSASASAPRRGRTWPGPRATSHVPSPSSPMGKTSGDIRRRRGRTDSSRSWVTCHPVPPSTGANPAGASVCVPRNQKVTPRRPDLHRPDVGQAVAERPAQHAVGGLEGLQRRHLVEAAQERGGVHGTLGFALGPGRGRPRKGSGRWRRRVRRASAAHAREPIPKARSSGR